VIAPGTLNSPIGAAIAKAQGHAPAIADVDPRVQALVTNLIGRVADKWTMILLELLEDHGTQRFTELARKATGVSQKMLTQTLRQMERDGLISRKVYPVIPPKVEYGMTDLGRSLGEAFCGVWVWAEANLARVDAARRQFDDRVP
jgi:DNA-binding HxlR family transcriptional regulator